MAQEVLEFIIVPPYEKALQVSQASERLKDYLLRRFPGYGFKVSDFAPVGDEDEFCIVPIMNYLDPEGKMRMCEAPSRWFMLDIAQACREFDLTGNRYAA